MSTIEILTLLTLIIALCSLICSNISSSKALRHASELSRYYLFAEYTKRYQQIIIAMPGVVMKGDAKLDDMNVMKFMRLYFDLCSEEFHLAQKGFIPDEIWTNWKEGMALTMKNESYRLFWKRLAQDYNDEFNRFFDHEFILTDK